MSSADFHVPDDFGLRLHGLPILQQIRGFDYPQAEVRAFHGGEYSPQDKTLNVKLYGFMNKTGDSVQAYYFDGTYEILNHELMHAYEFSKGKSNYGKLYDNDSNERLQIFVIAMLFMFFCITKGVFTPAIGSMLFLMLPLLSNQILNKSNSQMY